MTPRLKPRRRDRQGGYILFEALAALALSALVLAAVPLTSGMLIRNWEKVTSSSDTLDKLSSGLSVVRGELAVLQRVRWPSKRNDDGPMAFVGAPETVGMVVSGEGARKGPGQPGGNRIVMFTVTTDQNGSMLMRGALPQRPGITGFENIQLEDPVVLLKGPWRYKFYYADEEKGQMVWLELWEKKDQLPLAIRLDVLSFATGTRVIPPLVVPLRIDGDAGCVNEEAGPCGS
jgi:hypothetical protein